MDMIADLLERNQRYAASFRHGGKPAAPARAIAVLTCMDARLDPHGLLGLALGEAHVLRNAGGRASDDALRSLVISARLLGTRRHLVIHHTDCGLLGLSNDDLRRALTDETGVDAAGMDFLPFSDLEQSVRDDMEGIRTHPYIPMDVSVAGFVYDVETGILTPVDHVEA